MPPRQDRLLDGEVARRRELQAWGGGERSRIGPVAGRLVGQPGRILRSEHAQRGEGPADPLAECREVGAATGPLVRARAARRLDRRAALEPGKEQVARLAGAEPRVGGWAERVARGDRLADAVDDPLAGSVAELDPPDLAVGVLKQHADRARVDDAVEGCAADADRSGRRADLDALRARAGDQPGHVEERPLEDRQHEGGLAGRGVVDELVEHDPGTRSGRQRGAVVEADQQSTVRPALGRAPGPGSGGRAAGAADPRSGVLRQQVLDGFQRLSPRREQTFPAVVVDIDDHALQVHGQWP